MKKALASLEIISDILRKNNVEYSIGGSGLLYFLGLQSEVGDWDILVRADSSQIENSIKHFKYQKLAPKFPFQSQFMYRLSVEGFIVEILGNFKYSSNNSLFEVSSEPYLFIDTVPLSNPHEWYNFYTRIDRKTKNDKEKASLLKEWIDNEKS